MKFSDYSKEVQEKIEHNIEKTLTTVGLFVQSKAKENAHVVTGNLRSSIDFYVDVDSQKVLIGTNVEYAEIEEFRPGEKPGFGKHSFLRPAAEDNIDSINDIIKNNMKME